MDATELSQTAATYTRVAAPASGPQAAADVAVIAWHGMGQQIRFETVETIVRALVMNRASEGYRVDDKVDVRFVELGGEKMWRAELEAESPDGAKRKVHVYEAYWAPLSEGRITLRETIAFLFRTGLDALVFSVRAKAFRRHLFGEWRIFPVDLSGCIEILVLMLTLASLIVINVAIAAATSAAVLSGGTSRWPSYPLLADLTVDFLMFELCAGAALIVLWLVYVRQRRHRKSANPPPPSRIGGALIWILIGLAVAATVVAGALVALHLIQHRTPTRGMWWTGPAWLVAWVNGTQPAFWAMTTVIAVWTIAVLVSYVLQSFFVEYIGDVAIYVSSHRLDRYFETRQAIKDLSRKTAQAIYTAGGYPSHVIVGHSLGSLIAYDTLNRLSNEDALTGYETNVAARTRAFITLGSPLDKTAFLFRLQSEFSDVREAMAASAQPLITRYDQRPPWTNVSSANDPISGDLDYYDPPSGQDADCPDARHKGIVNVRDDQAWIPLLAHTQYFTNDLFVKLLREAIGIA